MILDLASFFFLPTTLLPSRGGGFIAVPQKPWLALAAEREPALATMVVPMGHRVWGLSCWRSFPTDSQLRIRDATHEWAPEFGGAI